MQLLTDICSTFFYYGLCFDLLCLRIIDLQLSYSQLHLTNTNFIGSLTGQLGLELISKLMQLMEYVYLTNKDLIVRQWAYFMA